MTKPLKYSNDRSCDNLILIFIHTYLDLKSLSKQDELSKNYLINKQNCLQEIQNAYFASTKLSPEEWDGLHNNDLIAEVPIQEISWFNATLNLAKEIYHKLEYEDGVADDDLKGFKNYVLDCISLLYSPNHFSSDLLV